MYNLYNTYNFYNSQNVNSSSSKFHFILIYKYNYNKIFISTVNSIKSMKLLVYNTLNGKYYNKFIVEYYISTFYFKKL